MWMLMCLLVIVRPLYMNCDSSYVMLSADPLCVYYPTQKLVYLMCLYQSDKQNLNEIVQEAVSFEADAYEIYIQNHFSPRIEDALFSTIPIEVLSLAQNSIEFISDQVFSQLSKCEYLLLMSNSLTKPFAINAPVLDGLYVENNLLETIERKMLNLPKATKVSLSGNRITSIEPDSFLDLKRLTELDLSNNRIQYLSGGLFKGLRTLEQLNLAINFLEAVKPGDFNGLDNLVTIKLQSNLIKNIEIESFELLPQLKVLMLSNLQLTNITGASFYRITKLSNLNMDGNFIRSITDDSLNNLYNLNSLSISDNLIDELCSWTRDIKNTSGLSDFDLSFNAITSIEKDCFKSFPRLYSLDLEHNKIGKIEPGAFLGVENNLNKLFLARNQFQAIKQYHFSDLVSLTELNLSRNQISTIEAGSFSSTANLVYLDLSHNCLYRLDPRIFNKPSKLIRLYLSYNLLQHLDNSELFTNLVNLQELYLDHNILYAIDGFMLSAYRLVNLRKLMLDSNWLTEFSLFSTRTSLSIETLSVTKNRLEKVNLSNLGKLKGIDISQNPIQQVTMFASSIRITSLNLSSTSTEAIKDTLRSVPSDQLDISYNQYVDTDSLSAMLTGQNVKKLYMRRVSRLVSVSFLKSLSALETLDLSENTHIPLSELRVITSCKSLTYLYLDSLSIESLTDLDFSRDSFKHLYLNWNRVKELRKNQLSKNLKRLYLKGNQVSYLEHGALNDLIYLEFLDLSENNIKMIEYVGNEFQELVLYGNQLESLPPRLNLMVVVCLNLSNNALTFIDTIVSPLVETLILNNNKITHVKNTTFISLKSIREINLNHNLIQTIDPNSFKKLFSLDLLDLSVNLIAQLDSLTLVGLGKLTSLNLSHNLIEYLDQSMFLDLVSLVKLDISSNRLRIIRDGTFEPMSILSHLRLNGNGNFTKLRPGTLQGLDYALDYIELDQKIMKDPLNVAILRSSLKPKLYPREVLGIKFYRSIDLVYSRTAPYADTDCKQILSFIKINLKLNLYTSNMANKFLQDCALTELFDQISN